MRVKQAVRFYKVLIIKSGGGEFIQWGRQLRKEWINMIGQAEFTTSPGRSDTGHVVFQRVLNYGWARARMIWKRWDVYNMDGMEWMTSIVPRDRINHRMNKYSGTSRVYNITRQVKYRSLGVSQDTELWLGESADDLEKMRCSQHEWYGMDDFNGTKRQWWVQVMALQDLQ